MTQAHAQLEGREGRLSTARRWLPRSAWAVADQALFAAANFLLQVLLARLLSPSDYGAFVLSFSALLLLGTAHTALLTEPMLVLGAGRYGRHIPSYLGRVAQGHVLVALALTVVAGIVVLMAVWLGMPASTVEVGVAALFAAPFVLYLWLMRRACYVQSRPSLAALAGLGYLLSVAGGTAALSATDLLDGRTTWALLAATSLLCALWLSWRLGVDPRPDVPAAGEVARSHWGYARWALPTGALTWVPANLFVVALPIWVALEGAAEYRAALNLVYPAMQFNAALGVLLLPALVRVRDTSRFSTLTRAAGALLLLANLAYFVLLVGVGDDLARLLYDGQYVFSRTFLWTIGLLPMMALPALVWGAAVRALERPDLVFLSYLVAAILSVTAGLALIAAAGVYGALLAQLLTTVAVGALLAVLCARVRASRRFG
jgi:O-antigen/teichoic acid export membrane protein